MFKLLARLILFITPCQTWYYCLLRLVSVEFTIIVSFTRKSYYRVVRCFNYLPQSVLLFIGISFVLLIFAFMFWLGFVWFCLIWSSNFSSFYCITENIYISHALEFHSLHELGEMFRINNNTFYAWAIKCFTGFNLLN